MKEKDKMKAYLVTGVDKDGKPIQKEIENFDEQVALAELEEIFDPMSEQHYQRERWDR